MDEKFGNSSKRKQTILCPSARCKAGAILLGVVQSDGKIAFLNDRIAIDKEFVQSAHEGRSPEKRFRFSDTCIKNACQQWDGKRCSVIEKVLNYVEPKELQPTELPHCSIRSQCRWYQQRGGIACSICPRVITDLTVSETNTVT